MEQLLDFVARHGPAVIFVIVFLDQLGFPIPTIPILLAFGALAGSGRIDPFVGLSVAVIASVAADLLWYQLGRWKGSRVLTYICRVALEPDLCVSKTYDMFGRYGVKSLLVAKFIPGFDTVAPPLAAILRVGVFPFALWSAGGALMWLGTFGGLGYVFSDRLDEIAQAAERLGSTFGLVVGTLIVLYLAYKFHERQRVLRSLRTERITPEELHAMITGGRDPIILDVRTPTAVEAIPFMIERAQSMTLEDVDRTSLAQFVEREVVVYCS